MIRMKTALKSNSRTRDVARSEATLHAFDQQAGRTSLYALTADLIPPKGLKRIQSADARKLARAALRAKRDR